MKSILLSAVLILSGLSVHAKSDEKRKLAQDVSADQIEKVFTKLDQECAGNDNGWIQKFDPKTFNAKKAKRKLRKENNGCKGTKMSRNKNEAIAAFTSYFNKSDDDFTPCVTSNLTSSERDLVLQVVSDPKNLGVFSSLYDAGDESEACSFYHFHVYRADGTFISIVHDETD